MSLTKYTAFIEGIDCGLVATMPGYQAGVGVVESLLHHHERVGLVNI